MEEGKIPSKSLKNVFLYVESESHYITKCLSSLTDILHKKAFSFTKYGHSMPAFFKMEVMGVYS